MSKPTAAKFSPMSAEQFAALDVGDEVVVKSGNVYRAISGRPGDLDFRQVKAGKLYGPSFVRFTAAKVAKPAA